MTDVIATPNAATEPIGDELPTVALPSADVPTEGLPPNDGDPTVEWAPIEPKPKKRRLGLWIGLGIGVLALGAGAASTILIAPGTSVAGISVGWLTPGAAADVISAHVAETEVTLTGDGDGVVLSGADLGATIDARALADQAFADRPMWNVGAWMGETVPGEITFDPATASSALRDAVPSSFIDPVDAGVVFDAATAAYSATPSETGTAINLADLSAAFADTVADGGKSLEFSGDATEAPPAVTDENATEMATSLNAMLTTIGFYVGEERTVPVDPAVAASWIDIVDEDGKLVIEADASAIQQTVDALPGLVDRAPVNATNIIDSAGKVLREEATGVNGRALADTSDVAEDFASQLETGQGVFPLEVTETPFAAVNVIRRIEVDISSQTTTLYENDTVVQSWKVSTGRGATPTDLGRFKVYAHLRVQDMKSREPDGSITETPNVPWVTYYNGDEAFHGTYWHNNFGNRMSHGCVNMPIDVAKFVYEWAPLGLEVWVHD